jgi:hypothetical protein
MKSNLNSKLISTITALLLGTLTMHADPYAKGDTVKAFTAKDQHEQAYAFDAKSTRYLLISHGSPRE